MSTMNPALRAAVRFTAAVLGIVLFSAPARAQTPTTLSLEEALDLARRNNPAFLQQKNDAAVAQWTTREAYGSLLPTSAVSGGLSYQAGGQQRFGVFSGSDLGITETPDYYFSDYSIGLNYRLSGATLFGIGQARSNESAVDARIEASEFALTAAVTRQYLAVLLAQDAVALAEQELTRAEENFKLASARVSVGAAIPLDEKQAAVERGRAEVALLQAQNARVAERLRLSEQIGIELPADVQLVSKFEVAELNTTKEALLQRAMQRHPNLRALQAGERAANAGVRMARSSYFPTVSFSMGWSGYTRQSGDDAFLIAQTRDRIAGARQECEFTNEVFRRLADPLPTRDCSGLVFTPAMEQQILAENDAFPFEFTKQPFGAQMSVSLPIFSGFARERQVESAKVAAADARHQLRAEELRLKTEIERAYATVETALRSVALEERTRELAAEQLELARERYRVGAANFLELKDAETLKARADRAYLTALYGYHEALAALEAAVGETLQARKN